MSNQSKKAPPTPEEILEQIKAAGQKAGSWGEMGGTDAAPLLMDEQVRLAESLKDVLRQQEKLLQGELQTAREALHRIKHGGGS